MFAIVTTPLDVDKLKRELQDDQAGALVTFEGCGIELGTISLGIKVSAALDVHSKGGVTVGLKAADSLGFAEIQFSIISVTDRGTLSFGGVPAN